MEVKKFSDFREESVNEEFLMPIIKGALGKLGNLFAGPFKNLIGDIKNMFNPDEPTSIKNIIMAEFNKAVDAAQKSIPTLDGENDVDGVMGSIVDALVTFSVGLNKDVEGALGMEKAPKFDKVAQAVLLGNKEADWAGIIGLLDPGKAAKGLKKLGQPAGRRVDKWKYSNAMFKDAINDAAKKNTADPKKAKKDAAIKFIDAMQKEVKSQLDKELSNDEIQKIYNQGGSQYKVGDTVTYLLQDKKPEWDKLDGNAKKNLTAEPAKSLVGTGKIEKIDGNEYTIVYGDNKRTKKSGNEIVGKSGGEGESNSATKLHTVLADMKGDEEKMSSVLKFSEFVKDPNNKAKAEELIKQIPGGGA
jgi:hypothetical protein